MIENPGRECYYYEVKYSNASKLRCSPLTTLHFMETPASWTVAGSPETNGCHQSKSLPSTMVRYAHVRGSFMIRLNFSGESFSQFGSILNRSLYTEQQQVDKSRYRQAAERCLIFPVLPSRTLCRQQIPQWSQRDSHSASVISLSDFVFQN